MDETWESDRDFFAEWSDGCGVMYLIQKYVQPSHHTLSFCCKIYGRVDLFGGFIFVRVVRSANINHEFEMKRANMRSGCVAIFFYRCQMN